MITTRLVIVGVFCMTGVLSSQAVKADEPLPMSIFSIIQADQDVTVTVEEYASSSPRSIHLFRSTEEGQTAVVSNVDLGSLEPAAVTPICGDSYKVPIVGDEFCGRYPDNCLDCGTEDRVCIGDDCENCVEVDRAEFYMWDIDVLGDFCELFPAYKVDCDDDGVADCCRTCDALWHFEFVDACVPPGTARYSLYLHYRDGPASWSESEDTIEVVDSGVDCSEPTSTDIDDTGEDVETSDTGTGEDVETSDTDTGDDDEPSDTSTGEAEMPADTESDDDVVHSNPGDEVPDESQAEDSSANASPSNGNSGGCQTVTPSRAAKSGFALLMLLFR